VTYFSADTGGPLAPLGGDRARLALDWNPARGVPAPRPAHAKRWTGRVRGVLRGLAGLGGAWVAFSAPVASTGLRSASVAGLSLRPRCDARAFRCGFAAVRRRLASPRRGAIFGLFGGGGADDKLAFLSSALVIRPTPLFCHPPKNRCRTGVARLLAVF